MAATKNAKRPTTSKKAASKEEVSAGRKTASEKGAKKVSALDAAARVLQEAGTALSCPELITAMAEKGYWKSPGGKTPQATLYSALTREIKTRGKDSRFKKAGPGKFASA